MNMMMLFNNKTESFNKINIGNLGEPFYNKSLFKPINGAIFHVFYFKDPFRTDCILIGRL